MIISAKKMLSLLLIVCLVVGMLATGPKQISALSASDSTALAPGESPDSAKTEEPLASEEPETKSPTVEADDIPIETEEPEADEPEQETPEPSITEDLLPEADSPKKDVAAVQPLIGIQPMEEEHFGVLAESSTLIFDTTSGRFYLGTVNITAPTLAVSETPTVSAAPPSPTDPAWVAGDGTDGRIGFGSYTWVPGSSTLSISGLTWSTAAPVAFYLPASITLMVDDTNTITSTFSGTTQIYSAALFCKSTLTIDGLGSITATGGNNSSTKSTRSYGIVGMGGVNINGATITAKGGNVPSSAESISVGIWGCKSTVIVTGGNITTTGGTSGGESTGLSSDGGLTIDGGVLYAKGDRYGVFTYSYSNKIILKSGGITAIGNSTSAVATRTVGSGVMLDYTGPYTYWVNTAPNPPSTSGVMGLNKPYQYSSSDKYLKIIVPLPGATLSPATKSSSTATSLTVNPASLNSSTGQAIEYALSQGNTTAPTIGWQSGLTFSGLTSGNYYYIWARSIANEFYVVGTAVASDAMQTNPQYTLSVVNGTDKSNIGPYEEGAVIGLLARDIEPGEVFDGWTSAAGGTFVPQDAMITIFTMPASNVTVTANFATIQPGANVSNPIMNISTDTTIVVNTVSLATPTGQEIEYGINDNNSAAPTTWQGADANGSTVTFAGLDPATNYYIWARSAANRHYYVGTAVNTMMTTNKSAGAEVVTPPTYDDRDTGFTSITVLPAELADGATQDIEYALSNDGITAIGGLWQTELTFSFLPSSTDYYVLARSQADETHYAGATISSALMRTNPAQYNLTVIGASNTSGGSYAQGVGVTIIAAPAVPGRVFDKWTSGSGSFANVSSPTTTFIMPGEHATVTATYALIQNGAGLTSDPQEIAGTATTTSLTISAIPVLTGLSPQNNSQSIEYGINKTTESTPPSTWQGPDPSGSTVTFTKLEPDTGYTVWARSTETPKFHPGESRSSLLRTLPLKHVLTVLYGIDDTGTGPYIKETSVDIRALATPVGMWFDRWTSEGGGSFDDATAVSTKFHMPNNDVTITANFYNIEAGTEIDQAPQYASSTSESITVTEATLMADTGQTIEYGITDEPDLPPHDGLWQDTTTFTGLVPDTDYYIWARTKGTLKTFAGVAKSSVAMQTSPVTYALTVEGGTDTTNAGPYIKGAKVGLKANAAPEGMVFDKWTSNGGGAFAEATSAETTFTMPANIVTVTAHYKKAPHYPSYFKDARNTYWYGEDTPLIFIVEKDFALYEEVTINGVPLDEEHHSVESGSTMVTLHCTYLDTLPVGLHTVHVKYSDGSVFEGVFTVLSKTQPETPSSTDTGTKKPSLTGDSSDAGIYLLILFVAGSVVITTLLRKNKSCK